MCAHEKTFARQMQKSVCFRLCCRGVQVEIVKTSFFINLYVLVVGVFSLLYGCSAH